MSEDSAAPPKRKKRADSVHTAHSTGTHAHDDIREGEGPFEHLDKHFADDAASSTTGSRLRAVHPDEPLTAVNEFHEIAARKWINNVIIVCATIVVLSFFKVNLAVSVVFIGLGVYSTRREVENLKRDFAWDFERQKAKRALESEDFDGESVEWLNQAIREVWPILDPNLFVAGVDLCVRGPAWYSCARADRSCTAWKMPSKLCRRKLFELSEYLRSSKGRIQCDCSISSAYPTT